MLRLKLFDEIVDGLEIGPATIVDVVIGFAFEGLELSGAYLELVHVLAEMADVITYGRTETLSRFDEAFEAALQAPEQRVKRVELNPVQELFLACHVMVDTGKADLGLGGNAPHGCLVVPHRGENPGRRIQKMKPLTVKGRGPFACGLEWRHRFPFERPFVYVPFGIYSVAK